MRLVYCSPLKWNSYTQRPHEFVWWYHENYGGNVLWIDPYPIRLPTLADFRFGLTQKDKILNLPPKWIQIYRPIALPIEPIPGGGHLNSRLFWHKLEQEVRDFAAKGNCYLCIGKPSNFALRLLREIYFSGTFYDAMDDFPAFYNGLSSRSVALLEKAIIDRVGYVIVSSSALKERFKSVRHDVKLIPNGCSTTLLPKPKEHISSASPVIGYIGTVGHWFDWDFLVALANSVPWARIEVIGPIFLKPSQRMPINVSLLPALEHSAALNRMNQFSIGLIPFKKTQLTASVDPIKYYEYRSVGLPVISTSFGEMRQRENLKGVFLVNENVDVESLVAAALSFRETEADINKFRSENNWKVRFDSMNIFGANNRRSSSV